MAEDASGQYHVVATTTAATPTGSPLLHFLPHTSAKDASGHHHLRRANTTPLPPPLLLLQLVLPSSTSPRTHLPIVFSSITGLEPMPDHPLQYERPQPNTTPLLFPNFCHKHKGHSRTRQWMYFGGRQL
ncbi:Uncharacterized protein Fot_21411 [Forsythia ovata]|uniref:Uncharacterized protein n=1 Tax=Forsythia ovata TaxID=205694 RepID=A0ABD1UUR9_9LAMI